MGAVVGYVTERESAGEIHCLIGESCAICGAVTQQTFYVSAAALRQSRGVMVRLAAANVEQARRKIAAEHRKRCEHWREIPEFAPFAKSEAERQEHEERDLLGDPSRHPFGTCVVRRSSDLVTAARWPTAMPTTITVEEIQYRRATYAKDIGGCVPSGGVWLRWERVQ